MRIGTLVVTAGCVGGAIGLAIAREATRGVPVPPAGPRSRRGGDDDLERLREQRELAKQRDRRLCMECGAPEGSLHSPLCPVPREKARRDVRRLGESDVAYFERLRGGGAA
jgi:hypothetical protein